MRVVLSDDQQLQSFLFFPTVPKLELQDEIEEDESESKKNVKAAAAAMALAAVRSTSKRKRSRPATYGRGGGKVKKGKWKGFVEELKWEVKKEVVNKLVKDEEVKKEEVKKEVVKKKEMLKKGVVVKKEVVVKNNPARWTEERYKRAERNLMEIVRERGGVRGRPVMRKELRDEARKVIGDTGLLDHLLKHSAGKVIEGGDERFMRRHNADGVMVYWLEPPEMMEVEDGEEGCGGECREEVGRLKELVGTLTRYAKDY